MVSLARREGDSNSGEKVQSADRSANLGFRRGEREREDGEGLSLAEGRKRQGRRESAIGEEKGKVLIGQNSQISFSNHLICQVCLCKQD